MTYRRALVTVTPVVLVLAALGLLIGRVLDGKLDLSQLTGVGRYRG